MFSVRELGLCERGLREDFHPLLFFEPSSISQCKHGNVQECNTYRRKFSFKFFFRSQYFLFCDLHCAGTAQLVFFVFTNFSTTTCNHFADFRGGGLHLIRIFFLSDVWVKYLGRCQTPQKHNSKNCGSWGKAFLLYKIMLDHIHIMFSG